MKRLLFALCMMTATTAQGQDWSLDVFVGGSSPGTLTFNGIGTDLRAGGLGGLGLFRSTPDRPLEFGVEIARGQNGLAGQPGEDLTGTSVMATGRYTLSGDGPIDGYAGLGLGVVSVDYDDGTSSESDSALAGQFTLGARYNFPSSTYEAFVEYRYLDTFEDASLPGGTDIDYARQDLVLGLRLGF